MESDGLPWLHCPGKFRHTAIQLAGSAAGGEALCEKPGVPASAQPFEGLLVLSRAHGRPAEKYLERRVTNDETQAGESGAAVRAGTRCQGRAGMSWYFCHWEHWV